MTTRLQTLANATVRRWARRGLLLLFAIAVPLFPVIQLAIFGVELAERWRERIRQAACANRDADLGRIEC